MQIVTTSLTYQLSIRKWFIKTAKNNEDPVAANIKLRSSFFSLKSLYNAEPF